MIHMLWSGVPPSRVAAVRILTMGFATVYVAVRSAHIVRASRLDDDRFEPVAFVSWLLDGSMGATTTWGLVALAGACGAAATAGWRYRVTGPLFAALLLFLLTYRNSFGQVLHTENLMVMHCLVLAVAPAQAVWSLDARRGPVVHDPRRLGWTLQLMSAVTAVTYLIAAWAKIRSGAWDWMTGDVLRNHIAHDNLRKLLLGDAHSALGGWSTRYGWLFPPLAIASMAVELGAVVAVSGHRIRMMWVTVVWLFHVGVLALMAILFPYQLLGVAFASMGRPERLVGAAGRWVGSRGLSRLRGPGPPRRPRPLDAAR